MNKKRKIFTSIICIILALLMALSLILMVVPSDAADQSDIERLQQKIENLDQQLTEQQSVIDSLANNQALIITRKAALDGQIDTNRQLIALIEEQIAIYDELVAGIEGKLDAALATEKEQTMRLRSRMRTMEENGYSAFLTFLFKAKSMTDLLSRLADVQDVMNHDKELETLYKTAKKDVQDLMDEYSIVLKEQEALKNECDLKHEQLANQVVAACGLISHLEELSADASAEYEAIEKAEQEAWEEQLAALAALAAQRSMQYSAQLNENNTITVTTTDPTSGQTTTSVINRGSLIWPTNSTYITSGYGLRAQPTAGASTNHQAIDIGANGGDPIYAAADGYVAVATYNDGLGYYVTIQHDDELSTRYSHMSSIAVSAGQYVTQGQIIGYVGCTGIATGDHLDYAVIENGQKVNPLDYYDIGSLSFVTSAPKANYVVTVKIAPYGSSSYKVYTSYVVDGKNGVARLTESVPYVDNVTTTAAPTTTATTVTQAPTTTTETATTTTAAATP